MDLEVGMTHFGHVALTLWWLALNDKFLILRQPPKYLRPHDQNESYRPQSTYKSHARCHIFTHHQILKWK